MCRACEAAGIHDHAVIKLKPKNLMDELCPGLFEAEKELGKLLETEDLPTHLA